MVFSMVLGMVVALLIIPDMGRGGVVITGRDELQQGCQAWAAGGAMWYGRSASECMAPSNEDEPRAREP
jgi:hypothetical protein